MRFAIDSNILVYSFIVDDPDKHGIASDIVLRSAFLDAVIATQALAEFLNVVRRKHRHLFAEACAQAEHWNALFPTLNTSIDHVLNGAAFATRHKLQLWDSIMWQVARSANAAIFLSEDMQDGLSLEGMTVINPFNAANQAALHGLIDDPTEPPE